MLKRNAKLLLELTAGHRHLYLLAALLLAIGTTLLYVQPIVVGVAVDQVLGQRVDDSSLKSWLLQVLGGEAYLRDHLWIAAVAIVAGTTLGGVFTFGKMRLGATAAERITRGLRDRLYNHLQHLPCAYHDTSQTGDLVQRCSSDVETTRLFYSDQVLELARASVLLLTALPLMFMIDPTMALVSTCILPIIVTFAVVFFAKVSGTFKAMDEAEGALTTTIQENLTGIRVVRAFARQDFEIGKFQKRNEDHRGKHWKLFRVMAVYWASSDFLCFSQFTLTLLVGAWRVSEGLMTAGTLMTFIGCVGIYIWPVRHMGRIVTELGKTTVAIGRIREILDAPVEASPVDASSEAPGRTFAGRVRFDDVSFSHGTKVVLEGISFSVEPGQTLALLGPSGSGKSTIAQLLMRLYDPRSGVVSLDGHDISTLPRKLVRRSVASVMQEPFLFGKTIRENIKLGRHDAPDDDMTAAARAASIHESISSFEKTYDTVVGERGVTLSGGQRQRVAIARALLKDAPVLILDDALSAVDTHTESMILDALRHRRGRHTTILIAHRLSTLVHADQILVIEHGRIVQRGTHATLVGQNGLYRRLWNVQTALELDLESELGRTNELVDAK
jgi:ATP-binding cassette subfamily B protein